MQRITSRQNPIVAEYRAAARGEKPGLMLLDGTHLIEEALASGTRLQHVMVLGDAVPQPEIAAIVSRLPHGTEVVAASSQVMDAASPVRSSSPVVALAARPADAGDVFAGSAPLVVVLCDIQDPGNVGAIVRVAEGAGASAAIVAGQCADPFSWKALRGSMGSALRLPIHLAANAHDAVAEARARRVRIAAAVPRDGTPLFESDLTGPTALLIGGEGPGLPADVIADADLRVTIPMHAPVESLNAAMASAVLLYEARRQRAVAAPSGMAI